MRLGVFTKDADHGDDVGDEYDDSSNGVVSQKPFVFAGDPFWMNAVGVHLQADGKEHRGHKADRCPEKVPRLDVQNGGHKEDQHDRNDTQGDEEKVGHLTTFLSTSVS